VYLMTGKDSKNAVRWALEAGYRGYISCLLYIQFHIPSHFSYYACPPHIASPPKLPPHTPKLIGLSFDSAQLYHNEREVGHAILEFLSSDANTGGLKREDIFYTTKLASNEGYKKARRAIKNSVKACGLGYIDLFLLHSPYGGAKNRAESWRAVEEAIEDGEVRVGGVR
jgi:hypothetical protein